jgi:hypothetical protein
MPSYSQEEAASLLGQHLVKINERLDAIEAKPVRDKFTRRYEAGRRLARSSGYRGKRLEDLEHWMLENEVPRHDLAMQLQPVPPDTNYFSGEQGDADITKLIESAGKDNAALARLVNSALREARQDDDY